MLPQAGARHLRGLSSARFALAGKGHDSSSGPAAEAVSMHQVTYQLVQSPDSKDLVTAFAPTMQLSSPIKKNKGTRDPEY